MSIVFSLVGKFFSYLKNMVMKVGTAIKHFTSNPVVSLAVLLPFGMEIVAVITFLVTYTLFIVNGGYDGQIQAIKENFGSLDGMLTYDMSIYNQSFMVTNKVFVCMAIALLVGQTICILISYFGHERKIKKILMAFLLFLICAMMITRALLLHIPEILSRFSEEKQAEWEQQVTDVQRVYYQNILDGLAIAVLVGVILFVVLAIFSKCRGMLVDCCMALLISYVILPMILEFIESIIAFVGGSIFLALVILICWIIFRCIIDGGEEQGRSSKSSASSTKTVEKKEAPKRKNYSYEASGTKFFKVHGLTHDYIERDNGIGTREICSLDAFRKGQFHIYDEKTGREITDGEIPWRK